MARSQTLLSELLDKTVDATVKLSERLVYALVGKASLGKTDAAKELENYVKKEQKRIEAFLTEASRGYYAGSEGAPSVFPKLLASIAAKVAVIRALFKALTADEIGAFLPLTLVQSLLVAAGFTPGLFYKNPLLSAGLFRELLKTKSLKQSTEALLNLNFAKKVYELAQLRAVPRSPFDYKPGQSPEETLQKLGLVARSGERSYNLGKTADALSLLAPQNFWPDVLGQNVPPEGGPLPYVLLFVKPGGRGFHATSRLFSSLRRAVIEGGLFKDKTLELEPFGELDFKTAFSFYLALLKLLERKLLKSQNASPPTGPTETLYGAPGFSFKESLKPLLELPPWHESPAKRLVEAAAAGLVAVFRPLGPIEFDDAIKLVESFLKLENPADPGALNLWVEGAGALNASTVQTLYADPLFSAAFLKQADALFYVYAFERLISGAVDGGAQTFNAYAYFQSALDKNAFVQSQKEAIKGFQSPGFEGAPLETFLFTVSLLLDEGALELQDVAIFVDDVALRLSNASGGLIDEWLLYGSDYFALTELPPFAVKVLDWALPAHVRLLGAVTVLMDPSSANSVYAHSLYTDALSDAPKSPLFPKDPLKELLKEQKLSPLFAKDPLKELLKEQKPEALSLSLYVDQRLADRLLDAPPLSERVSESLKDARTEATAPVSNASDAANDKSFEALKKDAQRSFEELALPFLKEDLSEALSALNQRLVELGLEPAAELYVKLENVPLDRGFETPDRSLLFYVEEQKAYVEFLAP